MRRRPLLFLGGALLTLSCLIGILVVVVPAGATNSVDVVWNQAMAHIRQQWMLVIAQALNRIGGGWAATYLVPLLLAVALALMRRWQAAIYALCAFLISAGLVQLLKQIFGRARPDDMLVASDFGSFPSGHTANAATIAMVLWVIFPRVWVAIAGAVWVLAMGLSRTMLSVHWVTDTVGGALIGAAAALLVAAAFRDWASLGWSESSGALDAAPAAKE